MNLVMILVVGVGKWFMSWTGITLAVRMWWRKEEAICDAAFVFLLLLHWTSKQRVVTPKRSIINNRHQLFVNVDIWLGCVILGLSECFENCNCSVMPVGKQNHKWDLFISSINFPRSNGKFVKWKFNWLLLLVFLFLYEKDPHTSTPKSFRKDLNNVSVSAQICCKIDTGFVSVESRRH